MNDQTNIKILSRTNFERLRALGMTGLIERRPAPAPNIIGMTSAPMMVDARVTNRDGTTLTRVVAISSNTPAKDIRTQVRSALNLDPALKDARIDKISIRELHEPLSRR